ncbi:hypothetical protein DVH05_002677 [Phytophthora capsici]|nr:hypothetical protein DVH05_018013 [Phytophthora capsici]KAG1706117.1 hypothetical protein DVH05_002677 [Phytophthora capsici]
MKTYLGLPGEVAGQRAAQLAKLALVKDRVRPPAAASQSADPVVEPAVARSSEDSPQNPLCSEVSVGAMKKKKKTKEPVGASKRRHADGKDDNWGPPVDEEKPVALDSCDATSWTKRKRQQSS